MWVLAVSYSMQWKQVLIKEFWKSKKSFQKPEKN
jgi:hypothetical protein